MNKAQIARVQSPGASSSDGATEVSHLDQNSSIFIPEISTAIEEELKGISHGTVTVQLHIRDCQLCRYVVSRERSIIPSSKNEDRPDKDIVLRSKRRSA